MFGIQLGVTYEVVLTSAHGKSDVCPQSDLLYAVKYLLGGGRGITGVVGVNETIRLVTKLGLAINNLPTT